MIKELTIESTQLPKDWKSNKLDSVINQFIVPQRDRPKVFDGNVPWCRIEDIDGIYLSKSKSGLAVSQNLIDSMPLRVYPAGTVIVSCSADLGRCAIISVPLITNQTFIGLVPSENMDSLYLYHLMGSKSKELNEMATGATIKYLSKKKFQELEIPIPPIKQQKQIVAILDKAFAAIDIATANAEQNLQNAKELFESYLQNVFENKGDDWEEKTIGDIGKPSMCKRILKEQTTTDGDIPFYKIGTFGKAPNAYISKELYEEYKSKYSFPKKGDILISASGTIGRRVIYNGEPGFFQDSNIVWIDNDEKQVLNEYLYSFYGYCDWQPSKGATISRLYNANLKRIKITFPKSLQEQKKVIKKIEVLSNKTKKLESIYTQKLADLEEMKKSVLQKAFSGQLNTIN